ncbi:MAG: hypothetical protein MUF13_07865 [Akkermansiaceae bacterium]|jgi:hypothetical protein|nr:hypothetical protein [Akkermansiaceae bacterium]
MSSSFHRKLIRPILALCLSGLLASPVQAARKVRAVFIQPMNMDHAKALLVAGDKAVEIELPQRNFSPEVELPDGDLQVSILSAPPPAGTPIPADAPRFTLPESWSRCLLLFFPDPANKVFPAKVIPVNASTADFPKGHTLIYNVTAATIHARFGSETVKVAPGKNVSLKPPMAGFGDYQVAIDCAFPGDKEPTAVCRSTWQHDPDARQILFVTPSPGYKVPRVWGILDREKPKDAAKPKSP